MLFPVATKQDLLDVLGQHTAELRALGVERCGLFGSFVRDEPSGTSDVDLLVEFRPGQKTFDHFMELGFLLEGLVGRKVELVTPESLSPHLAPHILHEVEYVSLAS